MRKKWYGCGLIAFATLSITLLAGLHLRSLPFETEDSASNEPQSEVFFSAAYSSASIRSPQSAPNFSAEHEGRILEETSPLTKPDESKATNLATSRPNLTKDESKATNSATSFLPRSTTTTSTTIPARMNTSLQHSVTKHSGRIKAPQNCKQKNCQENLSKGDEHALKSCENQMRKGYKGSISESDCKFLSNNSRRAVALASAPGAGNTWTRGLLEKASGICTGYLFCDTAMRAHGYVGENVKTGRVLVVKTHSIVPRWEGEKNFYFLSSEATYSAAVFILRNPVESAVAEWNRYSSMIVGQKDSSIAKHVHTYTLPKESFGESFVSFHALYILYL